MTAEEARANQERIAKHYKLSWWYGTDCNKCCGVYPKLIIGVGGVTDLCRYECEVCGSTTAAFAMPWQARDAWNHGDFVLKQLTMF